jgi:hypothetical protein
MITSVRQGIAVLLEQLTGGVYTLTTTAAVIELEIAAQHHSFVMGRGGQNIRLIQQKTGCLISFPEPTPPIMGITGPAASTVPNKKSTVTIRGANFDAAYQSWQELLMHLPLVLIFDLQEGVECDGQLITRLMDELKVSILVKPRQKANNKSLMVRCAEKDSRVLFEVRRQILGLDMSEVPYCCEQHYWNNMVSSGASQRSASEFSLPSSHQSPSLTSSLGASGIWSNDHQGDYWNSSRSRQMEAANAAINSFAKPTSGLFSQMANTSLANFVANHGGDSIGNSRKTSASEDASMMTASNATLDDSHRIDDLFSAELDPSTEMRLRAFRKVQSRTFDSSSSLVFDDQYSRLHLSRTMPETVRNLRSVQSADCIAGMDPTRRQLESMRSDSQQWMSPDHFQDSQQWMSSDHFQEQFQVKPFSQTSHFPSTLPSPSSVFKTGNPSLDDLEKSDLPEILSHFGLAKYLDNFENVELDQFLFMTPQDLLIRGIPFNARETMMTLIKHLRPRVFSDHSLRSNSSSTSFTPNLKANNSNNSNPSSSSVSGYKFSLMKGEDTSSSSSTNPSSSSQESSSGTTSCSSTSQSMAPASSGSNTSVSDDVFSNFFGSCSISGFEAAPGAGRLGNQSVHNVPPTPVHSPSD